jgi:hypothetical protein
MWTMRELLEAASFQKRNYPVRPGSWRGEVQTRFQRKGVVRQIRLDAHATDKMSVVPASNREPIIKSIEAENEIDLMFFHERNICSVYKAKATVAPIPYHLERFHQYVVIDR